MIVSVTDSIRSLPGSEGGANGEGHLSLNCNFSEICVYQRFEEQAARTPDATAVVGVDCQLTYRQLNACANRLARQLRREGVVPGMLIGLLCDPSPEMLIGLLAVLKAGGAYVPLDPSYPPERLAFMLEDADCTMLLTQKHLTAGLTEGGRKLVFLEESLAETRPEDHINLEPVSSLDDPIYVIFTSGSTGRPKGALVYHRGFANLMEWYISEFALRDSDRCLLISSFSFDLTQKNLYATLLVGGQLHLPAYRRYDVLAIRSQIASAKITQLNCTPSAFYPLVQEGGESEWRALTTLRCVFLGGEPIVVSRLRGWMESEFYHAEIVNTYGPTECTDIAAFHRLTGVERYLHSPVPIGRAIPNVRLYVLDDQQQIVPEGTAGELYIAGTGVGGGYLKRPELNAERFVPCPFLPDADARMYRTGDLVYRLPDGDYYFINRVDHQIKIRGFRVELGEIETVLLQQEAVRDAVVVVKDGSDTEPRLAAYIVTKSGKDVTPQNLRLLLRERLPEHMVPAYVLPLPALPLTPNGKVDRRALASLPLPSAEQSAVAPPVGEVERVIMQIWQDVLRIGEPDRNANFFDIGGDSINIAQVHARLCEQFGSDLQITTLFAYPTIRTLAQYFGQNSGETPARHPVGTGIANRAQMQRAALARRQRPPAVTGR